MCPVFDIKTYLYRIPGRYSYAGYLEDIHEIPNVIRHDKNQNFNTARETPLTRTAASYLCSVG